MTDLLVFSASAGLALFLWMHYIEPFRFQISRHRVTIRKKLPGPLSILHLSDIHFAGRNTRLDAFFDRLAGEQYDYVFISGDIIDCIAGIPFAVENLSKLKARHGIFTVLGNHDYLDYRPFEMIVHNIYEIMERDYPARFRPQNRQRYDLLIKALEQIGIRVLRNETVASAPGGVPVLIHGLDDATTGQASLRKTFRNYEAGKVNILLTHTVDVFLDIENEEIDLSFSGHSHGGQIRLPWYGAVITHTMIGREFASGIVSHKGAVCSISRGLGSSRYLRLRFLCRPEAILLTVDSEAD